MRKLLAILGVITCMIGLCACGQEETTNISTEEQDALLMSCESTINTMHMIINSDPAAAEQYAGDPVIYAGFLSLQSALGDIGEFKNTDGGTVSINGDEIIVEVNILGSKHNAVTEFIFSDTLADCFSITTNVTYSFGELMEKAALNTVIGMGTVFVVLVFISLIISCFGLFAKVDKKKQNKAEVATTSSPVTAEPVVTQIEEREELAGDEELVAVIAAAIAAYEGSGSTDGFVVRSIRKSNKSKWQNA